MSAQTNDRPFRRGPLRMAALAVSAFALVFGALLPAEADHGGEHYTMSARIITSPEVVHDAAPVSITFTITNESSVPAALVASTLTSHGASGSVSPVTCGTTSLAPYASTYCTATYDVWGFDLTRPTIDFVGLMALRYPDGSSNPMWLDVKIPTADTERDLDAALAQNVTVTSGPVSFVDDQVTFSMDVTNTGTVAVTNVAYRLLGTSGGGEFVSTGCDSDTLAAGASATCTVTYAVTQLDVDAGSFTLLSTVRGYSADGGEFAAPPAQTTVAITPKARPLSLKQIVSPSYVGADASQVAYTFTVTNTGTQRVRKLAIEQTVFTGTGKLSRIMCRATNLAPGKATTCRATYAPTEGDYVGLAGITSTAIAVGTVGSGEQIESAPSTATFQIVQPGVVASGSK